MTKCGGFDEDLMATNKDVNLTPSIISEPLIEDEEADRMAKPNFHLLILSFFNGVKHPYILDF